MATKPKYPRLAWLVKATEEYGTRKITAEIVVPQENGELHSPGTYSFDEGHEFDGFTVSVYLGELGSGVAMASEGSKLWGLSHQFQLHTIDRAKKARDVVRVFDRIERAMAKANTTSGYLAQNDFLGYLTRIGVALGITRYYVRNHAGVFESTGERFRDIGTSGADLQSWIHYTQHLAETKPAELTIR